MIIHMKILIAIRKDDTHTTTILPLHTFFFNLFKSYIWFSFPEIEPLSFFSSSKKCLSC